MKGTEATSNLNVGHGREETTDIGLMARSSVAEARAECAGAIRKNSPLFDGQDSACGEGSRLGSVSILNPITSALEILRPERKRHDHQY